MQRIDVVAAVIIRDGRILLTQRSPLGSYPLLYECPGGKVEFGETFDGALVRELSEELDVNAIIYGPIDTLPPVDLPSRDGALQRRVHFLRVSIRSQIPVLVVAADLGWFTADELASLKMTPANEARREELIKLVRGESQCR